MSAPTPGPWDIGQDAHGFWLVSPVSFAPPWLQANCVAFVRPTDNAEANARLIAAAPDLLELAHHFEAYLLGDGCAEAHELVVGVRSAIAKAEGGAG